MNQWQVVTGDCVEVLAGLAAESLDACVTDPPYDLISGSRGGSGRSNEPDNPHGRHGSRGGGFMGMEWDATGVAFRPETWREVYRVLKPGAHLLAFGGTRTFHRLTCAIEDAGWEIRDCLMWLYGQGFPKSLDVSKAIDRKAGAVRPVVGQRTVSNAILGQEGDGSGVVRSGQIDVTEAATEEARRWQGWGTSLKPAWEPIILARKPFRSTVAENVARFGTGAINVDGCRIGTDETITNRGRSAAAALSKGIYGDSRAQETHQTDGQLLGRWPANVVLDEEAARMLDEQSGETNSTPSARTGSRARRMDFHMTDGESPYADSGGASRFFYTAKASRSEREAGLHAMPDRVLARSGGAQQAEKAGTEYDAAQSIGLNRVQRVKNLHPTVKPVDLMCWLVRLVTPPGGLVLDPFAGSGTTGIAALRCGFGFYGVEREAEYAEIARARIVGDAPLFNSGG